jgi:hypothetical protein
VQPGDRDTQRHRAGVRRDKLGGLVCQGEHGGVDAAVVTEDQALQAEIRGIGEQVGEELSGQIDVLSARTHPADAEVSDHGEELRGIGVQ